jgi:glucose/arabinose dehydrogenase
MHMRSLALLLGSILLASSAAAQVTTKLVAGGLQRPLWAGAPEGDERIFIGLKGGQIRIVQNGALLPTPFLDLMGDVSTGSEQGLLGVAFHPDYASNGYFFVNYTDLAGATVVSRFSVTADPIIADEPSESILLTQNQPFTNHNGGDIHFGPDGYLYIFMGDGGSANDPACRAQKLTNIFGKVLRIDVDSGSPYAIPPTNPLVGMASVREEIFHWGLRNPWRNGFDRLTGDLYIGDVGQDAREEIDVAPAGSSFVNFGWKVMEANACNVTTNCDPGTPPCNDPAYTDPIVELFHVNGSFAITGGRVYRGCAIPSEYGNYFFADYTDHKIRSLQYDPMTGIVSNLTDRTAELAPGGGLLIRNINSFGEDGFGELLIVDGTASNSGEVFKLVPAGAPDANATIANGSGINRVCLTSASEPILGNVWEARVDAAGHPGITTTFLACHASSSSGTFFNGFEVLIDGSSPRYFTLGLPSTGTTDVIRAQLPCDVALSGLKASIQAILLGGGLELCNALDITLGYY